MDQFVAKYNGQYVGDGQCGTLVRQYWIEVDHTNPPSYPDSKDYWTNPVPGYDKVSTPQPGDIAIYNGHGAFPEGHSAIYVGGEVFEQNADPDGSPAHLYPRANTYLLGYLHKQGGDVSATNLTRDEVAQFYEVATLGETAPKDHLDYWTGHDAGEYGRYLLTNPSIQGLQNSYKNGGGTPTVVVNGVDYAPV